MRAIKLLWWLAALTLALLLASRITEKIKREPIKNSSILEIDWPLDSGGERHIHLSVPKGYVGIDGGLEISRVAPMPGGSHDRISAWLLFHTLWPNMQPKDGLNGEEFEVRGGGRALIVAMHSPARDVFDGIHIDELDGEWNAALDSLKTVCVPTGLPMPRNVDCHQIAPQIDVQELDLHKLARDYQRYPIDPDHSSSVKDLYERRDSSGALRTFISCSAGGVETPLPTTPQCAHFFVDVKSNSMVRIVYRKIYLAQWQEIQSATSALIAGFAKMAVKNLDS